MRLYDHLLADEPSDLGDEDEDWRTRLNPDSVEILGDCRVEPSLAAAGTGERYQFERQGYFCVDRDSRSGDEGGLVFNRTVSLRDSWARIERRG